MFKELLKLIKKLKYDFKNNEIEFFLTLPESVADILLYTDSCSQIESCKKSKFNNLKTFIFSKPLSKIKHVEHLGKFFINQNFSR